MYKIPSRVLLLFSLSMFIWNFSFAIFPNYRFNYNNDEELLRFVHKHPDAVFILRDKNIICNRYFYDAGFSIGDRIYGFPLDRHMDMLCELQDKGLAIYSDFLSKKSPFSRATLLGGDVTKYFRIIEKGADTISSFYGDFTIDRVEISCAETPEL